jgi:hypothetical protein
MASVKNLTTNKVVIKTSGNELADGSNYSLEIAPSATVTMPDEVASSSGVIAMVAASTLEVLRYDTTDDSPIGSDELRKLIKSGTVTLTAGTTSVVANTTILSTDIIMLFPADADAAALGGVFVDSANIIDSTSWQIDHASAAGTEKFSYIIRGA